MRVVSAVLLVACLALAGMQPLHAQDKPRDRGKFQERIEWMTMWKLMEALELDKATADKVYAIRRKYLDLKKKLIQEINDGVASVKSDLQQEPEQISDSKLAEKIADIRIKRRKLEGLLDEQFEDLSKVLSVRQQAKLVVFMKDFQDELRTMFHGPGPHHPGPPPPHRPGEGFGPPRPPDRDPAFDPSMGPGSPLAE